MDKKRRSFVKKVTIGTTGVSMGGISLVSDFYNYDLFANNKSNINDNIKENGSFPPIFPIPREAEYLDDYFILTDKTIVLIPQQPDEQDKFNAQFLVSELAERYGLVLPIKRASSLSGRDNYIVIGSIKNPLVKSFASANKIPITGDNPGHEGYYMKVSKSGIGILGCDETGAYYGLQSLRQLICLHDATKVQCAEIKDWPYKSFRGIRVNIPGPENIAFFKRFIRDFMAYFKYNKIIMEVNAVMRFDKHPELNAGWIELFKDMDYSRVRQSNPGPKGEGGNAVHQDAGDGRILEKEQVADLVDYATRYHIETIPEITSLPHSSYLLTRHRELAENKYAQWPDTYCPSNPKIYDLYFDVLDEYIDVMKPKMINIGHDEWRVPLDECENCKGKDYTELFVDDVQRIHKYLKEKNIRTAMWGDHLMESVRGKGRRTRKLSSGYTYQMPGGIPPEIVRKEIPKDILILNWFWKSFKTTGEENTNLVSDWGFEQIYGNFEPYIKDYDRRSKVQGVAGGAASAWSGTTEFNFGKILLYKFLGCANLLWSTHYPDEKTLARNIQHLVPSIRVNLKGIVPPSKDGDPVVPLDISNSFNAKKQDTPSDFPFNILKTGEIKLGQINFKLNAQINSSSLCALVVGTEGKTKLSLPKASKGIFVNRDVSSLIFLHSCAHPSENIYAHNKIHSYEDTSDLLGWYRVIYADGLIQSVPIRYGVNIREWHLWGTNPLTGQPAECLVEPYCNGTGTYCYEGDILDCSSDQDQELNFFAYEWRNPRFGTKIKEVYLEGSQQYRNHRGEVIDSNAIALIAISYVEKREVGRISAKSSG